MRLRATLFLTMFLLSSVLRAQSTTAPSRNPDEPAPGTRIVHPVDGAIMVYVPSGAFIMGIDTDDANRIAKDVGLKDYTDLWAWDAFPRRTVTIDGFFIDQCEVTVDRYRKFIAAHPEAITRTTKLNVSEKLEDQLRAAGEVTWALAQQYAQWAGKSIPKNAQWEKAARGTDGRFYPWGNDPPTPDRVMRALPKGSVQPQPVGQFPRGASPYGALDMIGNQYEWVDEWFESYPDNPAADRMKDYAGHKNRTVRGGSTYHGPVGYYTSKRMGFEPGETYFHIGFRTVWIPPEGYFRSPAFEDAKARVAAREKELDALRSLVPPTTSAAPAK